MTLITGHATVPASSTVPLFTVPAALCNVTMFNLGTVPTFAGTSTAVTTANGMQVPLQPLDFSGFVGSKGCTVYGTTGSSTASSIQYIVSTSE